MNAIMFTQLTTQVLTVAFLLGIAVSGGYAIFQQVVDAWSTYKVIRMGGSEKTKIVRYVMGKMGLVPALLLLKGGAAVGIAASMAAAYFAVPWEQLLVIVILGLAARYYQPILKRNLAAYRELKARQ